MAAVAPRLILASNSPRRRALLAELGVEHTVRPSNIDEEEAVRQARPGHPEEYVMLLAEAKARAVAREITEDALVIGADTIVWLDGKALNKPLDEADAARMLLSLAGRTHQVYTGLAIIFSGECVLRPALTGYEVTDVEFHPITEAGARAYVATGEPMDKAGAYGIQDSDTGARLVKAVRGDYYNVVGLPLARLRELILPLAPWFPETPAQPQMPFRISTA